MYFSQVLFPRKFGLVGRIGLVRMCGFGKMGHYLGNVVVLKLILIRNTCSSRVTNGPTLIQKAGQQKIASQYRMESGFLTIVQTGKGSPVNLIPPLSMVTKQES